MFRQLQKRKGNQKGFTIIEVLIVLAIAGLIMVIVFLAVPALQRSQRNQSRKTDVNNTLSAISDFTGNNGGTPPSTQANINTAVGNVKLGYYTAAHVYYGTTPPAAASTPTTTPAADTATTEDINVYVGYACSKATAAPVAGNARNVALVYVVEQASGNGVYQCTSS